MAPIDFPNLPDITPPKDLPDFPEKFLPLDLPRLESLPELLPTDSKIVIGMVGWAINPIPQGTSEHCHFPTGDADIRFLGGKSWERAKVTALDDIRAYSSVIIVDDKRNVIEKAMISTIKDTVVFKNSKNVLAGRTETSNPFETAGFNKIAGMIYADQDVDVYVDQSADNKNWDETTKVKEYTAKSNDCAFSIELVAPFARIRVQNTGTDPTTECRKTMQLSAGF